MREPGGDSEMYGLVAQIPLGQNLKIPVKSPEKPRGLQALGLGVLGRPGAQKPQIVNMTNEPKLYIYAVFGSADTG